MPLLGLSDEHLDTLSNQCFSRLVSQHVWCLLEDNFGVSFGVTLQLWKRLRGRNFVTIGELSALRSPIVEAHDPHKLLCANKVPIRSV